MIENQKKYAIVVVDMVRDYFQNSVLQEKQKELTNNINELCQAGRKNDIPVIWSRQEFKADLSDAYPGLKKSRTQITIENTPSSSLLPELIADKADVNLVKKRFSAFYKTGLETILLNDSITDLVICGVKTHSCVRTTAVDAYQNDYEVIIARDCVGDTNTEHADMSMQYLSKYIAVVLSNPEVLKLFEMSK